MHFRFLASIFCFFLCFPGIAAAVDNTFSSTNDRLAGNQEDFLTVEQAYQPDLSWANGQWWLTWSMADHYFLYQHGFKNAWIAQGKPSVVKVTLPTGIKKTDEYFGDVEVFYQQVQMPVEPAAGATHFKATAQGCADAGLCYPPYSVYFAIDNARHTATAMTEQEFRQLTKTASTIQPAPTPLSSPAPSTSLLWILLSALLGGLILNLMPCVLPVLSIKVMQLARHPESREARQESLAYMAGVILSFTGVAGLMLALRAGGSAIGWGFQLQNPILVATLVYLFFLLGLSMSGADMSSLARLGQRFMGMGQSLTDISGLPGAFFTGVLAVVVASPCTAPFMSAALGYAITQPPAIALLVFATLGFGMALPITLASFVPAAARCIPKPGHWMQQLKQFLAFPMYATAIWLAWVFGNQTGTLGMALLLAGCTLIAFALWCLGSHRIAMRLLALLALLAAITLPVGTGQTAHQTARNDLAEPFTYARLAELRQQGQPVFVDLTADWCITCKVNEKSTLEQADIQQAFRAAGIHYMVGDWTNYNPEITALLNDYHRSGIPLYLLFPGKPKAVALILPQILTPDVVREYIRQARASAR